MVDPDTIKVGDLVVWDGERRQITTETGFKYWTPCVQPGAVARVRHVRTRMGHLDVEWLDEKANGYDQHGKPVRQMDGGYKHADFYLWTPPIDMSDPAQIEEFLNADL